MTSTSSRVRSRRLMNKTDMLALIAPGRSDSSVTVRVMVERGYITLKSLGRQRTFRKTKMDCKHDLKVVWVSDLIDDELGQIKNCFVVITPEQNYILQADSHRMKIEWMQSLSIAISQSLKFRGSYRPASWSSLDDLHKWLMVREVDYHYQSHDVYKGAVYSGQWNMGMPHIHGRMKWTNGNCYDGEFMNGVYQGSGTMMWLSHPKFRHYTGSWHGGVIEGYGEMIFADQSVYTGWWHMGMRHRHGRMEYRPDGGTYTGGWSMDKRCGYGVMDDTTRSERYLGMWMNDKHNGAGIQVAGNKFQFAGSFIDGERSYDVTRSMRRKSISLVQDCKWEALFQSTAAILEQMTSLAHVEAIELSTPKSVFTDADSAVAMDFSPSAVDQDWPDPKMSLTPLPETPSGYYFCPGASYCGMEGEENGEGLGERCAVCRIEGFKSVDHPLGLLLNSLTKCFIESYSGIAMHANLLPHAISELCSVTTRMHQLVKKYCPTIITTDEDLLLGKPRTQLSMLMRSKRYKKKRGIIPNYYSDHYQTDSSWLYPIILPSIFTTLFNLYKEHHTRDDHKITHIISALNNHGDEELSSILEVRNEFESWKKSDRGPDIFSSESVSSSLSVDEATSSLPRGERRFSIYLQSATKILQTFSEYFTPGNKLLCIQEVSRELNQMLLSIDKEKGHVTGTHKQLTEEVASFDEQTQEEEEAMPIGILTFVIVRSRVKNFYSEIQFIQDFSGSTLLLDKYGSLLSKLKDSYYQLLDIKV